MSRKVISVWPGAVSRLDLATAFSVSHPSVTRWVDEGLPVNPDGTFDLKSAIAWRLNQVKHGGNDLNSQKTAVEIERIKLDVDKREHELNKIREESISRSEHDQIMTGRFRHFLETVQQETSEYATKVVGIGAIDIAFSKMDVLARNIVGRIRSRNSNIPGVEK